MWTVSSYRLLSHCQSDAFHLCGLSKISIKSIESIPFANSELDGDANNSVLSNNHPSNNHAE